MEEPKIETNDRMERFRLFLQNNGFCASFPYHIQQVDIPLLLFFIPILLFLL